MTSAAELKAAYVSGSEDARDVSDAGTREFGLRLWKIWKVTNNPWNPQPELKRLQLEEILKKRSQWDVEVAKKTAPSADSGLRSLQELRALQDGMAQETSAQELEAQLEWTNAFLRGTAAVRAKMMDALQEQGGSRSRLQQRLLELQQSDPALLAALALHSRQASALTSRNQIRKRARDDRQDQIAWYLQFTKMSIAERTKHLDELIATGHFSMPVQWSVYQLHRMGGIPHAILPAMEVPVTHHGKPIGKGLRSVVGLMQGQTLCPFTGTIAFGVPDRSKSGLKRLEPFTMPWPLTDAKRGEWNEKFGDRAPTEELVKWYNQHIYDYALTFDFLWHRMIVNPIGSNMKLHTAALINEPSLPPPKRRFRPVPGSKLAQDMPDDATLSVSNFSRRTETGQLDATVSGRRRVDALQLQTEEHGHSFVANVYWIDPSCALQRFYTTTDPRRKIATFHRNFGYDEKSKQWDPHVGPFHADWIITRDDAKRLFDQIFPASADRFEPKKWSDHARVKQGDVLHIISDTHHEDDPAGGARPAPRAPKSMLEGLERYAQVLSEQTTFEAGGVVHKNAFKVRVYLTRAAQWSLPDTQYACKVDGPPSLLLPGNYIPFPWVIVGAIDSRQPVIPALSELLCTYSTADDGVSQVTPSSSNESYTVGLPALIAPQVGPPWNELTTTGRTRGTRGL